MIFASKTQPNMQSQVSDIQPSDALGFVARVLSTPNPEDITSIEISTGETGHLLIAGYSTLTGAIGQYKLTLQTDNPTMPSTSIYLTHPTLNFFGNKITLKGPQTSPPTKYTYTFSVSTASNDTMDSKLEKCQLATNAQNFLTAQLYKKTVSGGEEGVIVIIMNDF